MRAAGRCFMTTLLLHRGQAVSFSACQVSLHDPQANVANFALPGAFTTGTGWVGTASWEERLPAPVVSGDAGTGGSVEGVA